jgi:hypothetical protein
MKRAVPFIRENYEPYRAMPEKSVYDTLAWYWNRGLMDIAEDRLEFRGICLIRPIENLDDFLDPLAFHPIGRFIWVELLIATDPVTIASLFNTLVLKWGRRETVLWDRGDRTQRGAPRMYRWDSFEKLAKRLTFGLTESKDYGTTKNS